MPIVPFLVMATYFLPEPPSSARKYPDGLRLRLTCNQLIGNTVSTKGTPHDLSTYGYILARLSRGMHLVK
jgi:hypothetical protein